MNNRILIDRKRLQDFCYLYINSKLLEKDYEIFAMYISI